MLVQVSVGRAVAASSEAEPGEDWPAASQVLRTDKLARNSELVLELDLVSQDVKLPFVGSKEEVSDPPQPGIEAESFFELGPVRLAQNRELDVSSRSELRPNATTAAGRAPCSGQLALEYDHVDAAAGKEVRARKTDESGSDDRDVCVWAARHRFPPKVGAIFTVPGDPAKSSRDISAHSRGRRSSIPDAG